MSRLIGARATGVNFIDQQVVEVLRRTRKLSRIRPANNGNRDCSTASLSVTIQLRVRAGRFERPADASDCQPNTHADHGSAILHARRIAQALKPAASNHDNIMPIAGVQRCTGEVRDGISHCHTCNGKGTYPSGNLRYVSPLMRKLTHLSKFNHNLAPAGAPECRKQAPGFSSFSHMYAREASLYRNQAPIEEGLILPVPCPTFVSLRVCMEWGGREVAL